jgi:ATP-dependent DNA helicase RecG
VSTARSVAYLTDLVHQLCDLPQETEWVEFKENNFDPQEIGSYISALANSAALAGKAFAYLIWGIRDDDHAIIGTNFDPFSARHGNEQLESWLLRLLEPKINFQFSRCAIDGCQVVVLEIEQASHQPVQFSGKEYIRIGSYKKPLSNFPEKERALWQVFDKMSFERGIAAERLKGEDVLQLLEYSAYFDLLQQPLPTNQKGLLSVLEQDDLIRANIAGGWDITHLGAILLARRLEVFRSLGRKAVRVIQYQGHNRIQTLKEYVISKGYAGGFTELLQYINGLLPANEVIGQALRKNVPMFPEIAIRELVANALIHQDFSISGAGPMIEIFGDRIEITNPGTPLVDIQRFLDSPPRSRNEALASLMRRFRICEERGSGIDKVAFQVELFQLPAPLFEVQAGFTRVVLFAHKSLSIMDKSERVRACYLHACLRYVERKHMTNSSLRERFGVEEHNRAVISRLIRESIDARLIVPAERDAPPKLMRYLPFWAAVEGDES